MYLVRRQIVQSKWVHMFFQFPQPHNELQGLDHLLPMLPILCLALFQVLHLKKNNNAQINCMHVKTFYRLIK